jgi:hypothetical protein
MSNPVVSIPASAGSLPPNISTRSMSPDRGLLGKIVGHLYIAAKILLEGRSRPIEEVRHEIRAMMYGGGGGESAVAPASSGSSMLPGSLQCWNQSVGRILRSAGNVTTSATALPDDLKKELAGLIKQGRTLCSVSEDAKAHVTKAGEKYLKLSGVSYL